jgi:hypothetical protein
MDVAKRDSVDKVKFRMSILQATTEMKEMIDRGLLRDVSAECTYRHLFTPIHKTYGCAAYARQIFLPKDSMVIGKIHRESHLNFLMQGHVKVMTEFGKKEFIAPCMFVSEVGLKRAVYALEDSIWVTVHLTKYNKEADLDKIEDEVIAPDYESIGMSGAKVLT